MPIATGPATERAPDPPIVPPPAADDEQPERKTAPPDRTDPPRPTAAGDVLAGDWIGTGESVEWPGIGPVSALTFHADGRAVVRAGSGVDVASLAGTWKHTGRDGDTAFH